METTSTSANAVLERLLADAEVPEPGQSPSNAALTNPGHEPPPEQLGIPTTPRPMTTLGSLELSPVATDSHAKGNPFGNERSHNPRFYDEIRSTKANGEAQAIVAAEDQAVAKKIPMSTQRRCLKQRITTWEAVDRSRRATKPKPPPAPPPAQLIPTKAPPPPPPPKSVYRFPSQGPPLTDEASAVNDEVSARNCEASARKTTREPAPPSPRRDAGNPPRIPCHRGEAASPRPTECLPEYSSPTRGSDKSALP